MNPRILFYIQGASADGVGPKLEPLATPPQGNSRTGFSCTDCSSGRGLRRDTRGYYQGVGTPGGLAGLVLPLSKCLVHWDYESDRRFLRWRIVSWDHELVMG